MATRNNGTKKIIGAAFAAFVFLFQILLLTRSRVLYAVLEAYFFVLVLFLLSALIRGLHGRKTLILLLLLTVLIRVPFYLHPMGMVTTGDNAIDALQPVEMRSDRSAPFFLHGALNHSGTIKPLWVAFIWDLTGNHYLWYLIVQLAVFIGLLFILSDLFARYPGDASGALLLLLGFLFFEVVFDYSLSIRGGPYLEMLLFLGLGISLIDLDFGDKLRLFLAYDLIFFSIYIHPLASILVGSFLVCVVIQSFRRKRFWVNAGIMAAGAMAGLFHWFYYLAFSVKPILTGDWEKIGLRPFTLINGAYAAEFLRNLKTAFANLFHFEHSYLAHIYLSGVLRNIFAVLSAAAVLISAAVLGAAAILAGRSLLRLARGKERPELRHFFSLFFLLLLGAILVKIFVFYPLHAEPRHNIDLAVAVMAAYLCVIPLALKPGAARSWKAGAVVVIVLALSLPHYATFYLNAEAKNKSYTELMAVLRTHHIRYVDTDFSIAYPIDFFSKGSILAANGIGPETENVFYTDQRTLVDRQASDRKAYVFYSDAYPASPRFISAVRSLRERIASRLKQEGRPFKTVNLKDYVIIIPENATHD